MANNAGVIQAELMVNIGNALAQLQEATAALRQFAGSAGAGLGPAKDVTVNLYEKMHDLRLEAVQHTRVFSFYGEKLAEVAGIGRETGSALVGVFAGLGSGMWVLSVIEAAKLGMSLFHDETEETAKTLEEFKKKSKEAATEVAALNRELMGLSKWSPAQVELNALTDVRVKATSWNIEAIGAETPSERMLAENTAKEFEKQYAKMGGKAREDELFKITQLQDQVAITKELTEANQRLVDVYNKEILAAADKSKAEADVYAADQLKLTYENLANEMQRLADEDDRAVTVQAKRLEEMAKELPDDDPKKFPMFGPGNAKGEEQFNTDALKPQLAIAQALEQAWQDVGNAMSGAFNALGSAIGGAAGKFLSTIGEMISQAIKFAIAMAAASVAQTPVIGGLMAAAAAIGLATSLVTTLASIPSYDVGTSYVPRTGLAMIHKGEAIVTAEDNARGAGRGTTVNVALSVSSWDGKDAYRAMTGARSELARVMREAVRDGVM